jgi:hypothetical protein
MDPNPSQLPTKIDLAIIGAGPHALTLVTHLLQKRQTMRGRFSEKIVPAIVKSSIAHNLRTPTRY